MLKVQCSSCKYCKKNSQGEYCGLHHTTMPLAEEPCKEFTFDPYLIADIINALEQQGNI